MGILEQIIGHLITHGLTNTPEKQVFFLLIGAMILAAWFLDYAIKLFSASPGQSSLLFAIALAIGGGGIVYGAETMAQQCACIGTVCVFLVARRMKSKSTAMKGKAKREQTSSRMRA
jgi:hypothetical protein